MFTTFFTALTYQQVSHCSTERTCYPGFKYTCCFLFPGIAVFAGGLFCFLVLEEESNFQVKEFSKINFWFNLI